MQRTFLLLAALVAVISGATVRYHGRIAFPDVAPEQFPPGSHLVVEVLETGIADGSAYIIAEHEIELNDYVKGQDMSYDIEVDEAQIRGSEGPAVVISISAELNVGWTPEGEQWIRVGDYLTDTEFNLGYIPGITDYEKDIYLVKYGV